MTDLDKRILTAIQAGLPVEERPFDALAAQLAVTADELLARLRQMVADGLVRRIGPVFDSRRLGYVSTLVAARVPPARLEAAATAVGRLPGVTHCYERRHAYNLWFTLTAPSPAALEQALADLARQTGLELHSLPALAVYKIRVQFDLAEEAGEAVEAPPQDSSFSRRRHGDETSPEPLNADQQALVRLIQEGLTVEPEPLAAIAAKMGRPVGQVVEQIRQWLATGVIRRFGAVVQHRELGFVANGMAVFRLPPDRVDEAGRALALRREVSHCYRRPALPDFPFNLYAMTHGRTEDEVRAAVAEMARQTSPEAHEVLLSVREFKKASMRYFVEGRDSGGRRD
jgi:siroheme decarboxylase